jgi:hypothetical protein
MNGLELKVGQSTSNKDRYVEILVEETLEVVQRVLQAIDWRRHEERLRRISPTDPVLSPTEFPRSRFLAADAAEQLSVHLANEPLAQRKLGEQFDSALKRPHVVEDLTLILRCHPRLRFGGEHLTEGRLRSFDPRARDCFTAEVWLDQEMWIRKP